MIAQQWAFANVEQIGCVSMCKRSTIVLRFTVKKDCGLSFLSSVYPGTRQLIQSSSFVLLRSLGIR